MKKTKVREVGNCALAQALRFHFSIKYREIAGILKLSKRTVWNHCNGEWGIQNWEDRSNKAEAIADATKILTIFNLTK